MGQHRMFQNSPAFPEKRLAQLGAIFEENGLVAITSKERTTAKQTIRSQCLFEVSSFSRCRCRWDAKMPGQKNPNRFRFRTDTVMRTVQEQMVRHFRRFEGICSLLKCLWSATLYSAFRKDWVDLCDATLHTEGFHVLICIWFLKKSLIYHHWRQKER